jgi:hypothetical protein
MNARRTFAVCLAVLGVGVVLGLACDVWRTESADAATSTVGPVTHLSRAGGSEAITDPSAIGRFQIVCGPLSRQDVYLLDTTDGRTWHMVTERESGRAWWSPVPRR